jgi:transposase InsO family protein
MGVAGCPGIPGRIKSVWVAGYYRYRWPDHPGIRSSLRDELLNEEIFDTLDDARRKLALWRYDYNNVRPHSSLGNQTPAEARRALEQFEGSVHDALAQTDDEEYEIQTSKLSL